MGSEWISHLQEIATPQYWKAEKLRTFIFFGGNIAYISPIYHLYITYISPNITYISHIYHIYIYHIYITYIYIYDIWYVYNYHTAPRFFDDRPWDHPGKIHWGIQASGEARPSGARMDGFVWKHNGTNILHNWLVVYMDNKSWNWNHQSDYIALNPLADDTLRKKKPDMEVTGR